MPENVFSEPVIVDTPSAPVLIFDSGVGGLSIFEHIRRRLPGAPVVYAMDSAGYPYGTRSDLQLRAHVPELLQRLARRYRPAVAVIACNTASTIALDACRAGLDIPVVGTVPAIKPAARISRTRVIGVLGTCATVRQSYVNRLASEFAADCTVLRHGAPELVDYAQANLQALPVHTDVPARAIQALLEQPRGDLLDTVVLACTHFPLIRQALVDACPKPLQFVDSGNGIAERVASLYPVHVNAPTDWQDIAVDTIAHGKDALSAALRRFGIGRLEALPPTPARAIPAPARHCGSDV